MNLAVFAFTRQGQSTARRCAEALSGGGDAVRFFAPQRLADPPWEPAVPPLADFCGPVFQWADAILFVGSCGIAVRAIAPHLRDKRTDPAVLSIDELARCAVPLLSGHIGGANALAVKLAERTGALAAVSTATDVNGRFSADAWAAENGLYIDGIQEAKAVSAAILEGSVPLLSDFPLSGPLPPGLVSGEGGTVGIYITWRRNSPFATTLRLIPPVVRLGIRCRRGTEASAIAALVDEVLAEASIHPAAVAGVSTIDLKKDEPGLLAFCRERNWPLACHSAPELQAVPGTFAASPFVQRVTGADNVCERAAAAGGGQMIVKKAAAHGVTVAAAAEHWEVRFG